MKLLLSTTLLLGVSLALAATPAKAQTYKFVATDSSLATKLCIHVGENNKQAMKSVMRRIDARSPQKLANLYQCNQQSLARFAHKYGANDTFEYLNRYSLERNKVTPNVTIRDVSIALNDIELTPIVIEVSSAE